MMDWSDRHCRYFFRQLSQRAVLYTEMVPAFERLLAACNGDLREFYARAGKIGTLPKDERPTALQKENGAG